MLFFCICNVSKESLKVVSRDADVKFRVESFHWSFFPSLVSKIICKYALVSVSFRMIYLKYAN